MTIEIKVPVLGESVTEATVAKWLKKVGDTINVDEPICELETEKVTMEVPSPITGTVLSIDIVAGSDVAVGTVLCSISEGTVSVPTSVPASAPVKEVVEITPAPEVKAPEPKPAPACLSPLKQNPTTAPSARIEAERKGVSISDATPTGGLGNITKQDIQVVKPAMPTMEVPATNASTPSVLSNRPDDSRGEERVPMSRLRKVIASRLKEAQNTAAMLTTFNEVDMTHLMALRAKYKDKFEKKHGTRLGFMSFFVKAAVQALEELPAVNAEIHGDDIVYKTYKDIGIAVGTPQGLVVPILRNAENMTVTEIEGTIAGFGTRAKDGKLTMAEMTGGTFTITNGGVFGSLLSTPILNPPQSAILGLHKIEKRPVVVDDEIVIRQMMYLALSYDHRIIDGREAVTFLVRVKELVEDPERLLLEI